MFLIVLVGLGPTAARPPAARAHSALVRSQPAPGALLGAPPAELRLWFSEPVGPALARVEVIDGAGRPVGGGELRSLPHEPSGLVVPLTPPGPGRYRVSWRVLSRADGHVTKGEFSFGVTDQQLPGVLAPEAPLPGGGPPSRAAEVLMPEAAVAPVTAPAEPYLKGLVLLLAAWLVGGAIFTRIVVRDVSLPRVLAVGPALLLVLVLAAWTLGWGMKVGGGWSALPGVLGTRPGRVFLARDDAAVAVLLATVVRPSARLWLGLVLLATLSVGSHAAATGDPMAPVLDWVHLVAAATWAGGLAHLAWLGWRRPASVRWGAAVRRFSNLALASVGLLALTGVYAGAQELGGMAALRQTVFGQLLSLKSVVAGVALILGAIHFRRWRPEADRGPRRFRWSLLVEVLALAGVLVVTGVLTSQTPGRLEPATQSLRLADRAEEWRFALEIRPGWTGANQLRLRLRAPEGETGPRRVEIALGVEPHPGHRVWVFEAEPAPTAPLEYVAATDKLTVPWNRWRAEVRIWTADGRPRVGSAGFALREPVDVLTPGRPASPWLVACILLVLVLSGVGLGGIRRFRRRRPQPTRTVAVGDPLVAP
jgi:copper transport protein